MKAWLPVFGSIWIAGGLMASDLSALSLEQRDDDSKIASISAKTDDSVTFQISLQDRRFEWGPKVSINYRAINGGRKAVYLVSPKPRLAETKIRWLLEVESPVTYPDEFSKYDNDLIKIPPGRSKSGYIQLETTRMPIDRDYSSENWNLVVSFSYLFDISGLKDCQRPLYALPCLTELYKKSKTVSIGRLTIDVENPN